MGPCVCANRRWLVDGTVICPRLPLRFCASPPTNGKMTPLTIESLPLRQRQRCVHMIILETQGDLNFYAELRFREVHESDPNRICSSAGRRLEYTTSIC